MTMLRLRRIKATLPLVQDYKYKNYQWGISYVKGEQVHFRAFILTLWSVIDANVDENFIFAVQRSPGGRLSNRFRVSHSKVWSAFNNKNIYPYHKQKVQNPHPGDPAFRLGVLQLVRYRQLYKYILFTVESQFTLDGKNNFRNEYIDRKEPSYNGGNVTVNIDLALICDVGLFKINWLF